MRVQSSPGDRQTTLTCLLWRVVRTSPSPCIPDKSSSLGSAGRRALVGCLNQFGQDSAQVSRVQESDRGAHRSVPRPLVEQSHPGGADGGEGLADVAGAVADMVDALAAAGEEPPDRGVGPEGLEQLNVAARQQSAYQRLRSRAAVKKPALSGQFPIPTDP